MGTGIHLFTEDAYCIVNLWWYCGYYRYVCI